MTNSSEKDKEKTKKSKLNQTWGGRFNQPLDEFISRFAASVQFDKRLFKEDIAGSIAHAEMLAKVELLTEGECGLIVHGLKSIEEDIKKGSFVWSTELEDVHMNIEAALVEKIGAVGKKLHTGRSRNDQVATDIKLWLRDAIDQLSDLIEELQIEVINMAENHAATLMPGFTHLQTAQPVTLGHHLLAWNEMLERDFGRFQDCRSRLNECPLGAAALAGTTFPIDRHLTASKLSFSKPTENSMDSVSDRDFAMEFCAGSSILIIHLSRICEEIVLWNSSQFRFIQISDRFSTGSSIMPQKKNPDVAELIRGKTGRITGNLMTLLMLMKSQPLAYNKDNQEDKEPLFDTVDALGDCLRAMINLLPEIEVQTEALYSAAKESFSTATDLADYLVRKNIPFREAHEIVGRSVAYGLEQGLELSCMPLAKLQEFSPQIQADVYEVLSVEGSVTSRAHVGGTAPESVKAAAGRARHRLKNR